jgi:hypothetical protein
VKISITAPERELAAYTRVVADQVEQGFTSGHVDATTHWQTEGVYDK